MHMILSHRILLAHLFSSSLKDCHAPLAHRPTSTSSSLLPLLTSIPSNFPPPPQLQPPCPRAPRAPLSTLAGRRPLLGVPTARSGWPPTQSHAAPSCCACCCCLLALAVAVAVAVAVLCVLRCPLAVLSAVLGVQPGPAAAVAATSDLHHAYPPMPCPCPLRTPHAAVPAARRVRAALACADS